MNKQLVKHIFRDGESFIDIFIFTYENIDAMMVSCHQGIFFLLNPDIQSGPMGGAGKAYTLKIHLFSS
jgi:hypothetical protein